MSDETEVQAIPPFRSQHPPGGNEPADGAGADTSNLRYDHVIKEDPRRSEEGQAGVRRAPRNYTVSQVPFPPYQKLANPGPLGLIGFALTTFVLGLYQCGAGYVLSFSSPSFSLPNNRDS